MKHLPHNLPGTPRDLLTIEAHLERANRNAIMLYEYRGMTLTHVQGNRTGYDTKLLSEIRNDLCALRSCIEAIQREREKK